jgi:hypothetical protein
MSEEQGGVLVAAPTYAGKEYSLQPWLDMYHALTYEPKHAYQVDNTRVSQAYYEKLKKTGIDCSHLQPWPDWDRTFRRCWEMILKRAKDLDCYWIYSVEADNTPDPESLEVMVNIALYGNLHLVTHSYPMHKSAAEASGIPEDSFMYHELGCMLMTRKLLEKSIEEFGEYGNIAMAIFNTNNRYQGGYCALTAKFKVGHLDGYEMAFHNLEISQIKGLVCPTPKFPKDAGTKLPPSLTEAGYGLVLQTDTPAENGEEKPPGTDSPRPDDVFPAGAA